MILAPRRFLREPGEVGAGDVMMVSNLATAHAAEEAFSVVRARAVQAVSLGMVDPVHRVAAVQIVP